MAATSILIHLEEIVEKWAWDRFDKNRTGAQRRLKRENLDTTVHWDRVNFHQGPPDFGDDHYLVVPNAQTLFKTTFTNNTDEAQDYSFQANRSTRSQATISIESGFTLGKEMGVKFNLPGKVCEANAGFKTELSLTKQNSQTFEEELSWGVNSQVRVKGRGSTLAEVQITEAKFSSNFAIESRLSGTVRITFTNRKKSNAFVTQVEGDVCRIAEVMLKGLPNVFTESNGVVRIITKGSCNFRYGCEQVVSLQENLAAK